MSRLPSTGPSLRRYLRQQARTAQRQQQSSAFNLSGTSVVAPDVTEVDGTLNVVGNLNVSGPAAITGTLSLPAGIIDNAALASPVQVGSASASVTNFATTATNADIATASITVPTGFTQALVFANAIGGVWNSNAVFEYIYLSVKIAGVTSRENTIGTAPSSYGSVATSKATLLTGLSGGTIALAATIRTDSAVPANATSRAFIEAIAVFLR